MLILTITEPNVDGCGTDVSTNLLVDTHGRLSDDEYALLESNVKNRVKSYTEKHPQDYDSDTLFAEAVEEIESMGYEILECEAYSIDLD